MRKLRARKRRCTPWTAIVIQVQGWIENDWDDDEESDDDEDDDED